MKREVALLILVIYLLFMVAQADVKVPVTSGKASTSSGGGSRSPDIENFIRQVESWKTNYKDRFEYLQKLLYKPAYTSEYYRPPDVWLNWTSNQTINRTDNIKIEAIIQDLNPKEIRRAQYLTLEIQEPGESNFKAVANAAVQIIQKNDYIAERNTTSRDFPEVKSLSFLKKVGEVKFRVSWTDGEYSLDSSREFEASGQGYHYFPVLVLNVKNIPPRINNSTMEVNPEQPRWDDYIQYTASLEKIGKSEDEAAVTEKDANPIEVTLHIYNNSIELLNKTKLFLPSDTISFSTNDFSFFKENDSGKNFTYIYSCTDRIMGGANTTWTNLSDGPHLRPNPKIRVSGLRAECEDGNHYWWQNYDFILKAKSLGKEIVTLKVDLYTDTPSHPDKRIASQAVTISPNNDTEISFLAVRPFDVADTSQTFKYYFRLSAPNQEGKFVIEENGLKINSKIMPYAIYDLIMLLNLALLPIIIILVSLLIERKQQRGIEAQESSSFKTGPQNMAGVASSGGSLISGIADKISAMIGRKD